MEKFDKYDTKHTQTHQMSHSTLSGSLHTSKPNKIPKKYRIKNLNNLAVKYTAIDSVTEFE